MYTLEIAPHAERDIGKLRQHGSRQDFERLRKAITSLAYEPRSQGVKKIKGAEGAYRIRVGSYRVIYEVHDSGSMVLILRVLRRNEGTYR